MERIDTALLAALGVLVVHQFAYSVSAVLGDTSSVAHGHLAVAWLLGSVAALAGLGVAMTRMYGFDGAGWKKDALGISSEIRDLAFARMRECGLRY